MLNQRTGPWSEPVYLHSSGFDASILHDDDGRKYIVSLDWETREGYEKPIVTSNPIESNERHDPDHLKPKYFNLMWYGRRPVMEVMWRRSLERCIWYIFVPGHSVRSFAARWEERLPSRK